MVEWELIMEMLIWKVSKGTKTKWPSSFGRIELCFENKRFWDIRRWKMPLDEKAKGMQIEKAGESLNYKVIEVENRNYKDYMYYGPIPYGEMLKWSNLQQNKGW